MAQQLRFWNDPEPEPGPAQRLRRWTADLRRVRRDDLSGELREIARLIGVRSAVALAEWRGGSSLTIPKRPAADHALSQALGHKTALAFASVYGGERLSIPSLRTVIRPLQARHICAEYDAGARVPDLVWRFGVSERFIRNTLNQPEEPCED